tara:strand:+ start:367 stop:732 length:366 start_codon:yes stop_codon:yes gene_type:complete
MVNKNSFKYFKTLPEIIRLAVMFYVRFSLSYGQVVAIFQERGIDICHETARFWVGRLGWNLRAKFERRGQGTTQIGNGIWTRFSSKLRGNDCTYGGPSIMKMKFWSVTFQNEELGALQRNF